MTISKSCTRFFEDFWAAVPEFELSYHINTDMPWLMRFTNSHAVLV